MVKFNVFQWPKDDWSYQNVTLTCFVFNSTIARIHIHFMVDFCLHILYNFIWHSTLSLKSHFNHMKLGKFSIFWQAHTLEKIGERERVKREVKQPFLYLPKYTSHICLLNAMVKCFMRFLIYEKPFSNSKLYRAILNTHTQAHELKAKKENIFKYIHFNKRRQENQ